jgi:hypothetical protein
MYKGLRSSLSGLRTVTLALTHNAQPKRMYTSAESHSHTPVMLEEAVRYMRPDRAGPYTFVDATFGAGGHSRRLLGT